MSDDGWDRARELVEALISLADVPLSAGSGKRELAERAVRAIQQIAAPWFEIQIGNVESKSAAIVKEIRDEVYLLSSGRAAAETFRERAIVNVLSKRIAALEGQTRVIREPQMTAPYTPAAPKVGQPSAYSEVAVSPSKALAATRVTLRNRLGDEWTVDNIPEGVPAISRFRRHGLGPMSEVQFVLDEHCRKYGIMGKDRVFVEPARVVPELRAVRWTDEAGEHEQVMGLEMAVAQLGNLRTEFSAFQKKANDDLHKAEGGWRADKFEAMAELLGWNKGPNARSMLNDPVELLRKLKKAHEDGWAKVRELEKGIGQLVGKAHDLVDFATSVGDDAGRRAAE